MTAARCRQQQRDAPREAPRPGTMVHAAPVLIAAAMLLAAGEPETGLHVEYVDDSAHPDIGVVVSAPQLDAAGPGGAFRVLEDGVALPVTAAAIPPAAVEVVLLVDPPALPHVTVSQVRSAVMDLMLRLPADATVSLVAAADPPEVVAEPGSALQARMLAASQLTPGERSAPRAGLAVALRQFSHAEGTVRIVVAVGADARAGAALPDHLGGRLAQRLVTIHAVQPAGDGPADGADRLVDRLSNLYRLTFEVGAGADEVDVEVATDGGSATATVALAAPPGADPAEPPAAGEVGRDSGASPADGSRWPSLLPALAAAAAILLLSAGIALPPGAAAGETGAEEAMPQAAARRVARERHEAASEMRAAGLQARLAAAVLGVQPLVAGALLLLFSRAGYEDLIAGAWRPAGLLAALVLTVAGVAWLRRVARPPFSAAPARWQAHEREAAALRDLTDALDRAYLYAASGLPLDEALARAGAGRPEHPARQLLEARGAGGASAAEVLAAASAGVRSEQVSAAHRQAEAVPVATAVPFVACVLPAIILLVVTGWRALGTG